MPQRGTSWLVTDGPDAAVGQVAMRTLRGRLRAVWAEAQAAAEGTAPEHVHRLRVATRRTLAALDVFRDVLPPRRAAWFRKRLRLLRQAAGDARDLDVLTGRLRQGGSRPEPAASAARSRLVAMLSRQRTVSRGPIRELYERLTEADWHGRVDTFLERVADRGRRTRFGDYARRRFGPLTFSRSPTAGFAMPTRFTGYGSRRRNSGMPSRSSQASFLRPRWPAARTPSRDFRKHSANSPTMRRRPTGFVAGRAMKACGPIATRSPSSAAARTCSPTMPAGPSPTGGAARGGGR